MFSTYFFFSDNDLTDKDAEALCKIIQVEQSIKRSKLTTHTTATTARERTSFKTIEINSKLSIEICPNSIQLLNTTFFFFII